MPRSHAWLKEEKMNSKGTSPIQALCRRFAWRCERPRSVAAGQRAVDVRVGLVDARVGDERVDRRSQRGVRRARQARAQGGFELRDGRVGCVAGCAGRPRGEYANENKSWSENGARIRIQTSIQKM